MSVEGPWLVNTQFIVDLGLCVDDLNIHITQGTNKDSTRNELTSQLDRERAE